MKKIIPYMLFLLAGISCTYEFPEAEENYTPGVADFSKVVYIGDNFMAGFMDGALYTKGQENSASALLSMQLRTAGGGELNQAAIASLNGYNPFVPDQVPTPGRFVWLYTSQTSAEPVIVALPGEIPSPFTGDRHQITDFSVPFIKSFQAVQPDLSSNIYFDRISANPGISSLTDQIVAAQPTFFVLWMGMYDVLDYALSGGNGRYNPPSDPSLLVKEDLTPADLFEAALRQMITTLLTNPDTRGAIASLPSIEDLPFFHLNPYNFLKLTNVELGNARRNYTNFNLAVTIHNLIPDHEPRPYIDFNDNGLTLYPQPLVVIDDSLSDGVYPAGGILPKIRQLKEGELVLWSLPQEMVRPGGLGWMQPLPKKYYLNSFEVHTLKTRIRDFNTILQDVAEEYPDRLVLVDLNTVISELAKTGRKDAWGYPESFETFLYDGIPLEADLTMNSVFSLDGLHLNQRGNAFAANLFIGAINTQFGSTIPTLDVNHFAGNTVTGGK